MKIKRLAVGDRRSAVSMASMLKSGEYDVIHLESSQPNWKTGEHRHKFYTDIFKMHGMPVTIRVVPELTFNEVFEAYGTGYNHRRIQVIEIRPSIVDNEDAISRLPKMEEFV